MKPSNYCADDLTRRSHLTAFYQSYRPLVGFRPFYQQMFLSLNSSYISQGILMKFSSYCFQGLKKIIFYLGYARLIFTRVMVSLEIFQQQVLSQQLLLQF